MSLKKIQKELRRLKNPEKAKILRGFFKTGKGQYGEGDIFLGVIVPLQRQVAKKFKGLPLADIKVLLKSSIHEHRLTALFILISQYEKGDGKTKSKIARFYLANRKRVNNWDLVDLSAPKILGAHLFNKDRKILHSLASSKKLWDRRIAILSTFYFIRQKDFKDALKISEILLKDKEDLIRKAVGWMLREVGKQSEKTLKEFLKKHASLIPRVTLRYAIEKFPEPKRKEYVNK
ncbi:MAG: DNA alkylation repair protein [Candidatus Pacebacteria bacterium]|nr:DNA alkylation repair protein [Candidatus Paceibacterota bacterium]